MGDRKERGRGSWEESETERKGGKQKEKREEKREKREEGNLLELLSEKSNQFLRGKRLFPFFPFLSVLASSLPFKLERAISLIIEFERERNKW